MHHALNLHPDFTCAAVRGIDVTVSRPSPAALLLHYVVRGVIRDVRLPAPAEPARADDLWRHTCFEAFLRPWGDDRYIEINLSPSAQWATYAFDGYRTGMRNADDLGAPVISCGTRDDGLLDLRAAIDLQGLHANDRPWRLGLSAVIEETSGAKSYWAATHAPGNPDFHHADSFSIALSPPEQT